MTIFQLVLESHYQSELYVNDQININIFLAIDTDEQRLTKRYATREDFNFPIINFMFQQL